MVKRIARLSILLFMAIGLTAYGQIGRINGTVVDATTGETLPGASVMVRGTTTGSITDFNGRYEFSAPAGELTIVASFVGYLQSTRQITLAAGETITLNFELASDVQLLEEFVVIGYGIQRREDATGSIAVVGERDFNRGNITTPSELLKGKMAGVQITSGGGAPGAGETIRIRGGSSLSALNDPLVVIDGVPVDSRGISGMRSALSMINPNDIETFTVLKDASATAIYGSRASNGVILITTKKGKEGQPLRLEYSGTFSLSSNIRTVDVLGADEFRSFVNQRFEGRENVLNLLGDASTDWQSEIYQNAFGHDHNISATGAVGTMPYRVSLGYSANDGVLKTDNMTRTALSVGLNPSFLDDHLKVNVNARGVNVQNQFAPNVAINNAVQFDPTQPVRVDDDTFGGFFVWADDQSGLPKGTATHNPVARLELTDDNSTVNRFIGNAQFDYKLPFLPELRANLNLGYDYSKSEGSIFVPDFAAWNYIRGGTDRIYDQEKRNELIDFYLNYTTELPGIQSRIEVMGGYSWQHFWEGGSAFETNIANNLAFRNNHSQDSLVVQEDTQWRTEYFLVSFFGRLNYSLMDRYLLTFTLRNDGTSRFVGTNRWGLFPAAAFAWRIDQEDFMQDVGFISELKLRAGYGVTGQQDLGAGNYPALARYTLSRQGGYYFFGEDQMGTLRPEGYDENLKWEETTTYNVGFDYGFANDRFTGSLDFYFRETKDLLNFISIPAGTNLTNAILTNIGNMENQGVEFTINTRPVVTSDLVWRLGFNATYSETKITKLIAAEDENYLGVFTGGIDGGVGSNIQIHSEGFAPNSFFVYQQVYDQNGNPIEGVYVDRNGDGQITDDDKYHFRNPAPKYYLGINSGVEFRNWEFTFAGRANIGNYMYNNVSSMNGNFSRLYRSEGPYLSNVAGDVSVANFNNPRYWSDFYIQDASFFKMDNISLAYNFGNTLGANTNLRVSFVVQNAFIITNYEGLDPEIAFGIDNNFYPRPRSFVLGVNLQL
jgi:TonB-dependent starch-binding outer membrane protein SusC